MRLRERLLLKRQDQARDGSELAAALAIVTDAWGSDLSAEDTWCTWSSTASDGSRNWSTR